MKKIIVILAKSAKHNNYCIAGIELGSNRWIRPVTSDDEIQGAVPAAALTYADKTEVQPLDLVQIEFTDKVAGEIQPENFYFAGTWKKFGHWSFSDFEKYCGLDRTDFIFYDDSRRLEPASLSSFTRRQSLLILPIENISVKAEKFDDGVKFRASFDYGGTRYEDFAVGDIALREKFSGRGVGEFFVEKSAAATFSLTNPFKDGRCYKVLAQLWSHSV